MTMTTSQGGRRAAPPPKSTTTSQQWQSVFRPSLFLNKIALVTGGGSGIGRSIALELAILGATVCIASRDRDKCLAAAEEMNKEVIRQKVLISSENADDISNNNACIFGRVVVGPSTSIRDEAQVIDLVSSKYDEQRIIT
jgi:NAD(P)-dependent dehydrogenase (short-subunit alcohol dehydrogenase family)